MLEQSSSYHTGTMQPVEASRQNLDNLRDCSAACMRFCRRWQQRPHIQRLDAQMILRGSSRELESMAWGPKCNDTDIPGPAATDAKPTSPATRALYSPLTMSLGNFPKPLGGSFCRMAGGT